MKLQFTDTNKSQYVSKTFSQIAPRYNFMNHLMTGGMDIVLRREVIRLANPQDEERLLDLGTGTGDLAREARRKHPGAHITAADFSLAMMSAGKNWKNIERSAADALHLPFRENSFDVIVSGYLVRNVSNLGAALTEQYRVLKPGGRIVILDTTRPRRNLFSPFINFYFRQVIPALGALFNGNREAYTYLTQSTQNFVTAEELAEAMQRCGFVGVNFRIRMFGTMVIHDALKQ
jgi:demethylmenaquinone methyltransferase/2-methoxy-6-polyprenyl-1,4-benzoquinol methylase